MDIQFPTPNATYKSGAEVSLMGTAYDYQDGEITGDTTLVWSSSVQGNLGKGESVNLSSLKPGTHVITLKATNSFTLTASSAVTITVGN